MKIIFVINDLGFFISHRLEIARAAKNCNLEVHIIYGDIGKANIMTLLGEGFRLHFVPIQRGGINPFVDLRTILLLFIIFKKVKPQIVHLVTIKPVIYGSIAARFARVPGVLVALAGLGSTFTKRINFSTKILRKIIEILFKFAIGHPNQILLFQNKNDQEIILSLKCVPDTRIRLIRGSGVDISTFSFLPEPNGVPTVAMASRLLRDKGVFEFVEAAHILRKRGIVANFWLIGEPDLANPSSITSQEFELLKADSIVKCMGYCKSIHYLYAKANIIVLPSYYGEGLPKCLIEAAACGRAIITTDMPGCRDAIEPNITGLLVPPQDCVSLSFAIEKLIKNPNMRKKMGIAGRNLAEREFDIDRVVNQHLQIYITLLNK